MEFVMAYVTTTQLSQRLGSGMYARLTDRVNGTTPDDDVGQQIIDEAEALANGYLARRYAVPVDLSSYPELANVLAVRVLDLAEYGAWKSSPFVADPPSRVQTLLTNATKWFEDVATGRLVLPATPPATISAVDGPWAESAPRQFTRDELDGL